MGLQTGWDTDTIADARDVLDELSGWRLSPQRWARVRIVLDQIVAALTRGDAEDFRDAVDDLVLSGPTRFLRIGTTHSTGVPDQILERRDKLVHALSDEKPPLEPGPEVSRDHEQPR